MASKKSAYMFILCAALLITVIFGLSSPEKRAAGFVERNGDAFAELVRSNQVIPSTWGKQTIEIWDEEHLMYEFVLGHGFGDKQYWGVYYSPDDVPLPFQNTDIQLSATDKNSWVWQSDGDNHGKTKKITDRWYYFEASF